jgi:HlyD family secretion protein
MPSLRARDLSPVLATLLLAGLLSFSVFPTLAADEPESPAKGAAVTVIKAAKSCFANIVQVPGYHSARGDVGAPERMRPKVAEVTMDAVDSVTAGRLLPRLKLPEGGQIKPYSQRGLIVARSPMVRPCCMSF